MAKRKTKKKVLPGQKGTTAKPRKWKVDRQSYLEWCEGQGEIVDLQTEVAEIVAPYDEKMKSLIAEQEKRLAEMRENAAVPDGVKVNFAGTFFIEQPEE